jgi:gamma-glutamyltranspeptidase/glutathione hydrolase
MKLKRIVNRWLMRLATGTALGALVLALFRKPRWPLHRCRSQPITAWSFPRPAGDRAGLDVLRRGGNAVDAAVAVAYALAVTFPEAGNLGGGGFMTLRLADGTVHFLDFRETAPGAARATMYLDKAAKSFPACRRAAGWRRAFPAPSRHGIRPPALGQRPRGELDGPRHPPRLRRLRARPGRC